MIKPFKYGEIDGVKNFSNSQIMSIWDKIVEEGKEDYVNRIAKDWTREDFLKSVKSNKFDFWIFIDGKRLFGIVWVIRKGKRAELHWCTFKGFKNIIKYGKWITSFIMDFYKLDVLYGFTPENNKLALKYLDKIGWSKGGVLPRGSYSYKENKSTPAVLMYRS